MRFKKIAILMALTILISGCGKTASNDTTASGDNGAQTVTENDTGDEGGDVTSSETPSDTGDDLSAEPSPSPSPEPLPAEPLTFIEDCGTTTLNGYTVKPIPDNEAFEFITGMHGGINLGNAFDAFDCTWVSDGLDYESAWCGAKTTNRYIDSLCSEGINVIRIPVSWHDHVDGNYNIDQRWLARVTEVVDYCLGKDMYVIINIHHDTDKSYFYPDSAHRDNTIKYTTAIWTQLAENFKDRSNKLIFECINEPRLKDTDLEWWFSSENDTILDAYKVLMEANQAFVDTVRASGGNNADRFLMICGYCQIPSATTSANFDIPIDTVRDRIIVSVHSYRPYDFAGNTEGTSSFGDAEKKENKQVFSSLYDRFVANGIPVIIGEYGCIDKKNPADRLAYYQFMGECSALYTIPIIAWDNNEFNNTNGVVAESYGIFDRASGNVILRDIVDAITATYKK